MIFGWFLPSTRSGLSPGEIATSVAISVVIGCLYSAVIVLLNRKNFHAAAEMVRYLVVAWYGGPVPIRRISPPRMVAAFADQFASVIRQMPYLIATLHG